MGHPALEAYADSPPDSPEREPFVKPSTPYWNGHSLGSNGHHLHSVDEDSSQFFARTRTWVEGHIPPREHLSRILWTSALTGIFALILGILIGCQISNNEASVLRPAATNASFPQQCRSSVGRWSPIQSPLLRNGTALNKPEGSKIVAVVFFGRRQYVDILDCYLRKNLVHKGGYLDEVRFLIHSSTPADEKWLRDLVADHEADLEGRYKLLKDEEIEKMDRFQGFPALWGKYMTDPDTLYFKIDDDIIYIDDATIPRMTHMLLSHPEAHNVQANVVNNMRTHWYHFHAGAIRPYLPETEKNPPPFCNTTWRASELPCYDEELPQNRDGYGLGFSFMQENHRWLPLENTPQNMMLTPMSARLPPVESHCNGAGDFGFGGASEAQIHYSFLHNLEDDLLSRYDFGNEQGTWNLWGGKYNINFMAIRGSTVSQYPFWGDFVSKTRSDERVMTIHAPKSLQMPVLVDTRSIVSHFSFRGDRREYLLKTDVLSRYRAYANEMVCEPANQKAPLTGPYTQRRKNTHDEDEVESDFDTDNDNSD